MVAEGTVPRPTKRCDSSASPGTTACGVVSFGVAIASVALAYSLVAATLVSVSELAAAAAVYALFLVWGVAWLLLATGYQRLARTPERPRRDA